MFEALHAKRNESDPNAPGSGTALWPGPQWVCDRGSERGSLAEVAPVPPPAPEGEGGDVDTTTLIWIIVGIVIVIVIVVVALLLTARGRRNRRAQAQHDRAEKLRAEARESEMKAREHEAEVAQARADAAAAAASAEQAKARAAPASIDAATHRGNTDDHEADAAQHRAEQEKILRRADKVDPYVTDKAGGAPVVDAQARNDARTDVSDDTRRDPSPSDDGVRREYRDGDRVAETDVSQRDVSTDPPSRRGDGV